MTSAYEKRNLPYPGLAGALANFTVQKVHFQTDSAYLYLLLKTYGQDLGHLTSNQENNGTLFSSTLKVEESKVSLFSGFEVKLLSYSHLIVLKKRPSIGV